MLKKRVQTIEAFQTGSSQRWVRDIVESGIRPIWLYVDKIVRKNDGETYYGISIWGKDKEAEEEVLISNDPMLGTMLELQDDNVLRTFTDYGIVKTKSLTARQVDIYNKLRAKYKLDV